MWGYIDFPTLKGERMEKVFKPRIDEINSIGDELKFQRDYYNYIKEKPLVLSDNDTTKSEKLYNVLQEYLDTHFGFEKNSDGDNEEWGTNREIISKIEKGAETRKDEKYDINKYYLRIYCLLKIYNFISDDYDIFTLLNKYGIKPKIENTIKIVNKLKQECNLLYDKDNLKIEFDLEKCLIPIDHRDIKELIAENDESINYTKGKDYWETKLATSRRMVSQESFKEFKNCMIREFQNLSKIERKCVSLQLGKATNFIDDVLNQEIKYITLETLLKILKYLQLEKSDIGYFIEKRVKLPKREKIKRFSDL